MKSLVTSKCYSMFSPAGFDFSKIIDSHYSPESVCYNVPHVLLYVCVFVCVGSVHVLRASYLWGSELI